PGMTGGAPAGVATRRGPFFLYAVPQGWEVVEDGQFAVVARAPDQRAITVMVGNAGLPLQTDPGRFLHDKLAQSGLSDLRFAPPRAAAPALGFAHAWEHEVDYVVMGMRCHGVAKCSVAPSYD